ncbi:monovalent cation/H+ antiporter complex subunit F [Vitiosangium sp. GDMCC 1.1324]|uniref:monovalent cation/H+ antiporter complex subunit F n=1 Tax=Vitiosangium sp. (strain GDMCC 1.1324) TaxID=2138576 RepID=UPI000D38FAFE|nr:monovalent cation/H+ antiporter complex subunit F [Vitiosangium sp. GDMCC 1.1324]PTL81240.1 multiple resistance and pH regulation protein F [Vitiosangium sp. GDMCC 1.1324]
MSVFYAGAAVFLLVILLGVLVGLMLAPTSADRMLAACLSGSLGVAVLLLVSVAQEVPMLVDVALVLVALGAVAISSFASRPQAAQERAR